MRHLKHFEENLNNDSLFHKGDYVVLLTSDEVDYKSNEIYKVSKVVINLLAKSKGIHAYAYKIIPIKGKRFSDDWYGVGEDEIRAATPEEINSLN